MWGFFPQLRRNMISLGTLDATGYIVKIEKCFLRVLKDYLVSLRVINVNSLYIYLGTPLDNKVVSNIKKIPK